MLKNKKVQIIAVVLGISIIGGIAYNMNSNKNDEKTNTTTSTSNEEGLHHDHSGHNHGEGESCAGNSLLNSSGID